MKKLCPSQLHWRNKPETKILGEAEEEEKEEEKEEGEGEEEVEEEEE